MPSAQRAALAFTWLALRAASAAVKSLTTGVRSVKFAIRREAELRSQGPEDGDRRRPGHALLFSPPKEGFQIRTFQ